MVRTDTWRAESTRSRRQAGIWDDNQFRDFQKRLEVLLRVTSGYKTLAWHHWGVWRSKKNVYRGQEQSTGEGGQPRHACGAHRDNDTHQCGRALVRSARTVSRHRSREPRAVIIIVHG
ncbi:hypothetical protein MRX96_049264 [Rhipicephalus microplus]